MAFRGWPVEAVEFFDGLTADNSQGFWLEHKAVYESSVRPPMDALLEDLASEFGAGKVCRPLAVCCESGVYRRKRNKRRKGSLSSTA